MKNIMVFMHCHYTNIYDIIMIYYNIIQTIDNVSLLTFYEIINILKLFFWNYF